MIAAACALALAATFPRFNVAWLMPLALAGLFAVWYRSTLRSAALYGAIFGLVYFAGLMWWVGETAAPLVGPAGLLVNVGPALVELPFLALAGVLATRAFRYAPRPLAPLGAAAAFTLCEWLRSIGVMGCPFGQLGYTQVGTPLAALGAFGGTYGITLVLCTVGAYVGVALVDRTQTRSALVAVGCAALLTAAAWLAWPARTLAQPTLPVAAIQAGIKQSVKWQPDQLRVAVDRHTALTLQAAAETHPTLIVWPETVITTVLSADPGLQQRFAGLARAAHASLVVGSVEKDSQGGWHNALWIYGPTGSLDGVYRKRQLVPFAEFLPWRNVLGGLPLTNLISTFVPGTDPLVVHEGPLALAPLICWESGFADVTYDQVRAGANLLVIASDDAWFEGTAGPDQHVQMAQMRAIETGRWAIEATPTGITALIAPDGRFTRRAPSDIAAVLAGNVGAPVPTLFSTFGPTPVGLGTLVLLVGLVGVGTLVRAREGRRS